MNKSKIGKKKVRKKTEKKKGWLIVKPGHRWPRGTQVATPSGQQQARLGKSNIRCLLLSLCKFWSECPLGSGVPTWALRKGHAASVPMHEHLHCKPRQCEHQGLITSVLKPTTPAGKGWGTKGRCEAWDSQQLSVTASEPMSDAWLSAVAVQGLFTGDWGIQFTLVYGNTSFHHNYSTHGPLQ